MYNVLFWFEFGLPWFAFLPPVVHLRARFVLRSRSSALGGRSLMCWTFGCIYNNNLTDQSRVLDYSGVSGLAFGRKLFVPSRNCSGVHSPVVNIASTSS
jgi:hypothetical protein